MAEKKRRGRPGRPRNLHPTVRSGYRFAESTVAALDDLLEQLRADAPAFAIPNQRQLLEALICRAKREFDQGELDYNKLFIAQRHDGKAG